MKQNEILAGLHGIRRFREERAEAELGDKRRSTRKAKEVVDEKAALRASHLADAEAAERRRLRTMTGAIVDASSLQELDAQRSGSARRTEQFAAEERSAQSDLEQSLDRLGEAQNRYKRLRASGLKLEELIKLSKARASGRSQGGSADDNEEWPF